MIVAVTGASGHIGINLLRALVARGDRVRAVAHEDNRSLDASSLTVERVPGDVRDAASLERAFAGAEVVFHLAAQIALSAEENRRVQEINVGGTRNVLAACRAAGVRRLLHFSSIHAYSPSPADRPVDETRALVPEAERDATPYDRSKASAQRAVLEAAQDGLDAVVLNPTGVIGPHDYRPSAMGTVLLDLHHRRLPGLVDGGFNWVDARDVVAGALAASERGRRGEAYLLSGHWTTVRELASIVEEVTGVRAPRMTTPMWLARAAAPFATGFSRITGKRPLFTAASLKALRDHRDIRHDKATRELGYAPRPLRETIADTYAWFREAGRL
jgi:dihydroflavonol-4-reductase